jgi:hypothetical protein
VTLGLNLLQVFLVWSGLVYPRLFLQVGRAVLRVFDFPLVMADGMVETAARLLGRLATIEKSILANDNMQMTVHYATQNSRWASMQ